MHTRCTSLLLLPDAVDLLVLEMPIKHLRIIPMISSDVATLHCTMQIQNKWLLVMWNGIVDELDACGLYDQSFEYMDNGSFANPYYL